MRVASLSRRGYMRLLVLGVSLWFHCDTRRQTLHSLDLDLENQLRLQIPRLLLCPLVVQFVPELDTKGD